MTTMTEYSWGTQALTHKCSALSSRIRRRAEPHFFGFEATRFVLSTLRPISPLYVGCILDHQEPLFPLSTRFALCFEIYAALPSSLQEDPGESQAQPPGPCTMVGIPPTCLRRWVLASGAVFPRELPTGSRAKGPSFAYSQRPFCTFVLLYCLHFIVSTSLVILIYNKLHCVIVHKGSH